MKQHATPVMLKTWLHYAQIEFLRVLLRHAPELKDSIKLQGGNALRLAWGSRRFSEDIDLLLDHRKAREIEEIVLDAGKDIERGLRAIPACGPVHVEIKARSRKPGKRLLDFCITTSADDFLGNAKLKLEFWPVSREYLDYFESEPSTLGSRLVTSIKVASLNSLYHDKLGAICSRAHFKSRDVYDLWWISRTSPCEIDEKRFMNYLLAYNIDLFDASPSGHLILDAARSPVALEELKARVIEDLYHWLPNAVLRQTTAKDFHEMALHAATASNAIHSILQGENDTTAKKSAPRFA